MNRAEVLRALLLREFGIEDDAGLLEAVDSLPELDLGIFCSPVCGYEREGISGDTEADGSQRLRAG